jgi:uncharacterized protein (TIGR02118 family)
MFKLMILIEPQINLVEFERSWPEFLKLVEEMPGLRKESLSPVYARVYGEAQVAMIHELYFDTPDDLQAALGSPAGQAAGRKLQDITGGKFSLLFADHLEDELKNFLTQAQQPEPNEKVDRDG